jgi:hypothetical protein
MGTLGDRDREILDFERGRWRLPGSQERIIRMRFDVSSARYHQLLNRLIETPEALSYDPVLVRRLRRLRESRRRKRCGPRLRMSV